MEGAEFGIAFEPQNAQRRRYSTSTGRQNDPSEQYQDVRPGRPREQIGKTYEAREKARRQRIVGAMQAMGVFHPTRRIDALNRDNPGVLRQIESAITSALAAAANIGHIAAHDQARRHTCSDRCSLHAP